jgi:TolB-like protein/DNA-binding winged helix-turn-helix (wHTH) protein
MKLARQPFEVLRILVERPGENVTREEIRQRIWPDNTSVDYDLAIKKVLNRLRDVLSDSAENPRFIETIPRRGYRFIAPVTGNTTVVSLPAERVPLEARAGPAWYSNTRAVVLVTVAGAGLVLSVLLGISSDRFRWRVWLRDGSPSEIHSVAVLPLENLSYDPDQEYFSDGMTDALITELAQIGSMRVISRTSSMQYKQTKKSLSEIARELNVDGIIEGTVQRSGDRVRITARLIYAPTDTHLWANNFERDLRDVLRLQDDIAREVATQIKAKVTPQEQTRLAGSRPVNPEAHELYLKGRYYWNKRTPEALTKGLEYFQQAIEKDPTYAPAYAGVADSYAMLGAGDYRVLPPKEAYPKAEGAARKALELDSTLAEAHTSLAWSKMVFDWDWQGAEREFEQAIELNPGYANAHHWFALYLSAIGRHGEAIAEDRKAESLDPLSLITSSDLGKEALGPAGLYDQEMEQCRKTLEMDPNFAEAHDCLANALIDKGMYREAIAESQKAVDLSKNNLTYIALLGNAYALAGRRGEARR